LQEIDTTMTKANLGVQVLFANIFWSFVIKIYSHFDTPDLNNYKHFEPGTMKHISLVDASETLEHK